ncbi:MerR family transcriptional regulator [Microtetraspora malaysiensis]|uniref:MerR family transcriptional regulator n=1 Tax=Microtetraspora malaysiensis TaxID=161358 RepID=UPI003D8E67C2
MTTFRISEAAALLGVSSDTVRRWMDAGRLNVGRDQQGHRQIDGATVLVTPGQQIRASVKATETHACPA